MLKSMKGLTMHTTSTMDTCTINLGPCTIRPTLTQQYKQVGARTAESGIAPAVVHVQTAAGHLVAYLVGCEWFAGQLKR